MIKRLTVKKASDGRSQTSVPFNLGIEWFVSVEQDNMTLVSDRLYSMFLQDDKRQQEINLLKKRIEELEEALENPPVRVPYVNITTEPPDYDREFTKPDFTFPDQGSVCLFEQFKGNNPTREGPLMLSCPCERCSPHCIVRSVT